MTQENHYHFHLPDKLTWKKGVALCCLEFGKGIFLFAGMLFALYGLKYGIGVWK